MRGEFFRQRKRIAILATVSAGFVAMLASLQTHAPLVLYNASGSAPLGFYRVEQRLPQRGETAIVQPPPLIEMMIVARGILAPDVPLVKQVAAMGGDEVCRSKVDGTGVVSVNGKTIAETFEKDREGRPLPSWDGCLTLIEGEYFLLQPHPHSFDSRYFGPVMRCDVIGVARPVWTWNPPG